LHEELECEFIGEDIIVKVKNDFFEIPNLYSFKLRVNAYTTYNYIDLTSTPVYTLDVHFKVIPLPNISPIFLEDL